MVGSIEIRVGQVSKVIPNLFTWMDGGAIHGEGAIEGNQVW